MEEKKEKEKYEKLQVFEKKLKKIADDQKALHAHESVGLI